MWRTVGGSGLGCFSWLICGGRWNPQSFHWNCCRSKRLLEVKHLELLTLLITQYISWSILNCMNNLIEIYFYIYTYFKYMHHHCISMLVTMPHSQNTVLSAIICEATGPDPKGLCVTRGPLVHQTRKTHGSQVGLCKSSKTPILKLHWFVFYFYILLPEIGTSTSLPLSLGTYLGTGLPSLSSKRCKPLGLSVLTWHQLVSRLLCRWHPLSLPRNCHGQAPNLIPFPM